MGGSCANKGTGAASKHILVISGGSVSNIQSRDGSTVAKAFPQIADAYEYAKQLAATTTGKYTITIHLAKGTHYMLRSNTYSYYRAKYSDGGDTHQNMVLTVKPLDCSVGTFGAVGAYCGTDPVTIIYKRRDTFEWLVSAGLF